MKTQEKVNGWFENMMLSEKRDHDLHIRVPKVLMARLRADWQAAKRTLPYPLTFSDFVILSLARKSVDNE